MRRDQGRSLSSASVTPAPESKRSYFNEQNGVPFLERQRLGRGFCAFRGLVRCLEHIKPPWKISYNTMLTLLRFILDCYLVSVRKLSPSWFGLPHGCDSLKGLYRHETSDQMVLKLTRRRNGGTK